jgi:hypothetical protein
VSFVRGVCVELKPEPVVAAAARSEPVSVGAVTVDRTARFDEEEARAETRIARSG